VWITLNTMLNRLDIAIRENQRRLTLRTGPVGGRDLERLIRDEDLSNMKEGSHEHRAMLYVRNLLRHDLAKRGYYEPQHDPRARIDTGLTFRPEDR
jgi:hypothetical protein